MKRINFKRVLSLAACFAMLLGTLMGPVSANAADGGDVVTGGYLQRANSYDWDNGYLKDILVFASKDANATADTIVGTPSMFAWQYGLVLEYNAEKGAFVVTASDMDPTDGTNVAETTPLGDGKLVIIFHGDVAGTQGESFEYFTTHAAVGTEYFLAGDYDRIVATSGKLTGNCLTTEKPLNYWTKPEGTTTPDTPATAGSLHRANSYDWDNGYLKDILVFASTDANATADTIIGTPGMFAWQYGLVLEFDAAKNAYVVTVSDMDPTDGVNAAESVALGDGKLVVIFHGDVAGTQAGSFNYFTTYSELGRQYQLTGDFNTIAATYGALTGVTLTAGELGYIDTDPVVTPTPAPQVDAKIGKLTKSNAYDWLDDHLNDIIVLTSDDSELEASAVLGQASSNNVFGWWYGITLEYNEEKGVFVVTKTDMNPDGVCEMEAEKLGYGKMVIIFYPDVVNKQPESFAYFTTKTAIGTEHYLVGNYDDMILCYDKLADTYLTTEKPESYWTKPEVTPEPTPEPTKAPEATQAPEPTKAPDTPATQDKGGVNPIVIAIIAVAVVGAAGAAFVVIKKRKPNTDAE